MSAASKPDLSTLLYSAMPAMDRTTVVLCTGLHSVMREEQSPTTSTEMASGLTTFHVSSWVQENEKDFEPPVCNKAMYSDQLKAFFVGGPNQRADYHIEAGEELFYQVSGDMCLKVVEKGEKKDMVIKERHMFLLPARIQHSPQRFAGTIGCVVERTRAPWEKDGLRYFVKDSTAPLYERWFHLEDVVKDLPPVIKGFFASEAHATGAPTADSVVESDRPYEPDHETTLDPPFDVEDWIKKNFEAIKSNSPVPLFDTKKYKTQVLAYGEGSYKLPSFPGETLLLQMVGKRSVVVGGETLEMDVQDLTRIPADTEFELRVIGPESVTLLMRMPTPTSPNN
uniref:3-hydroxyanthranilate 3,4-dioxygenase n=1 Tax=Plectus sambesii TaxID=2011161 RepID=A0A914VT60_9BILA